MIIIVLLNFPNLFSIFFIIFFLMYYSDDPMPMDGDYLRAPLN